MKNTWKLKIVEMSSWITWCETFWDLIESVKREKCLRKLESYWRKKEFKILLKQNFMMFEINISMLWTRPLMSAKFFKLWQFETIFKSSFELPSEKFYNEISLTIIGLVQIPDLNEKLEYLCNPIKNCKVWKIFSQLKIHLCLTDFSWIAICASASIYSLDKLFWS